MYNSVSKTLLLVDDIPVTTDGRELCLLVRLVQLAGKWFSSSLALGTDVVANITDMIPSNRLCCHIRANNTVLPTLDRHPHSSTGSEPDSPVQPWFRSILCPWFCVLSRATFREMIYSWCSEPLFHNLFRYQSDVHSLETSYCTFIFCSRCFLKFQLERYFCHIPWIVPG